MAKVLIEGGLVDPEFIRAADGFEGFARALAGLASRLEPPTEAAPTPASMAGPTPAAAPMRHGVLFLRHLGPRPGDRGPDLQSLPRLGQDRQEGCGVNPVTGISNIVGSYDMGAPALSG